MKYYFNDISTTPGVFYLLILIFTSEIFALKIPKIRNFGAFEGGGDQRGACRGDLGKFAVPRELSYLFGNNVGNNGTLPSHVTQSW